MSSLVDGVLNEEPGSPSFVLCARELGDLALSKDQHLAQEATKAIFGEIVEPWSDSFEPELVDSYVAFMSEVVYAPRSPIAKKLVALGLPGPQDLRERYQRIRKGVSFGYTASGRVKRVMVLSRVTLGADIAVTSVCLLSARIAFRSAKVEVMGPRKNAYLLSRGKRTKRRILTYGRGDVLADRLKAWLRLRAAIRRTTVGLEPGEWAVLDPDSRLTQLGLLPVTDDRYYDFFESRSAFADRPMSMREIAGHRYPFDIPENIGLPRIPPLRTGDRSKGSYLRRYCKQCIAAVSFGVGGREAKRLGGEFEDALLELLRKLGFCILLDYGGSDEEARVVEERIKAFRGSHAHLKFGTQAGSTSADLFTVRGSLSAFGGWMTAANVFVGYDSASAHLAAAYRVPVIEVFAGAPNKRFMQRWTPCVEPALVIPGDDPDVMSHIRGALQRVKAFYWYLPGPDRSGQ